MNKVAVVSVTWNRCQDINRVIKALSQQNFPLGCLDVIVVDNASTDKTADVLAQTWHPDEIVDNFTKAAHEPQFKSSGCQKPEKSNNHAGFSSLTLIRNHYNHGGCGGFNTGFAYIESVLSQRETLDYVWLVDDDVDLPTDALKNLLQVAESDKSIGIVGARAVDFHDRQTTLQSTVYFDFERGEMADDPPISHPLYEDHCRWITTVGGTRGQHQFTGVRDVDAVAACSMLARWSAVREVGFWDYRYFIYCDDADWCLRFIKAGYRVVCNLDAVVYHTPWFSKLTLIRLYYFERNLLWLLQKGMSKWRLRYVTFRRLTAILYRSLHASFLRRLFQAEVIRRTAEDVVTNHGGKLDAEGSQLLPVEKILDAIDALNSDARIVVLCNHPDSISWAEELRTHVGQFLAKQETQEQPTWIYLVRNDVPLPSANQLPQQIIYSRRLRSMLRRQLGLFLKPPSAAVVFDCTNDFALLRCPYNVHISRKQPTIAQLEPDNWRERIKFFTKWCLTAFQSVVYSVRVKPYVSPTKYG